MGDSAAVVQHADGTAILDPATGEELGRTSARLSGCSGEGDPMLVCGVGEPSDMDDPAYPATIEVGKHTATVRLLPGLTEYTEYRAVGKWMFARKPGSETRTKADESDQYSMLDAQGREIIGNLPGGAVAADGHYVALLSGRLGDHSVGGATLTMHRRQ